MPLVIDMELHTVLQILHVDSGRKSVFWGLGEQVTEMVTREKLGILCDSRGLATDATGFFEAAGPVYT